MEEPAPYPVVASQVIFDHPNVRILRDTVDFGDSTQDYLYLISPVESVATVGLTAAGEILLTRQYRHPVRREVYDLPGGHLEPGESPLEGARREFEEETGYYPVDLQPIGHYNQFPGMLRVLTHLFFASQLRSTQQRLDEGERLDVVALPVQTVLDMILRGEFVDGSLQLGVLLAKQKGLLPEKL